jgi:Skp family chaperone for outer membrane proteins
MKLSKLTILLISVLAIASGVFAQTPATPRPTHIGVVNSQQALLTSAEGKRAATQIQNNDTKLKTDLAKIDTEIQALQTKISTQRLTMTEEALLQAQADLDRKATQRKRGEEDASQASQRFTAGVLQKIRDEMLVILNALCKEKGFDLVLDAANGGVAYINPEIDITGELIKRYDASKAVPAKK